MCTGAEIAYLVVAAVGTAATIDNQRDNARFQEKQLEADAATEKQAGELRAQERRDRARRIAATARANLAASGVDIDSETSNAINADIIRRGELDASLDIDTSLDAADRLRAQAGAIRLQGQQAQTATALKTGTAISQYGARAGWFGS